MSKNSIRFVAFLLCLLLVLTSCGTRGKTLDELLEDNPNALSELVGKKAEIKCKDYTIYNTGGGIEDAINATRYSEGLREISDRFVSYRYIVEDNQTGWLYIFESVYDIPTWAKQN